jgi:hypothetical protein
MISSTSLFGQLLSLIPRAEFARAVRELGTEKHAKGFRSWDQFVAMLFCQLAQAKSLREITSGLRSCVGKLSHLGLGEAPKRSTLAYANEHRSPELFERMFYRLLARCQEVGPGRHKFRFKNKLQSLDASLIELCATMFDWAKYRRTKGAVKLHLLLDHAGYLPRYAVLTEGREHEVRMARGLKLETGSIIVLDRGYTDYDLFADWCDAGVWFVTRLKRNADYEVVEEQAVPQNRNILKDEIIWLPGAPLRENGEAHWLRRIEVAVAGKAEPLVLLTNHLKFGATTIAAIYQDRWQIELFFKALKQNLRVKTFVGTSANALRTQIWTALIAMLLLKYLQFKSKLGWALSNLVALLRWNLFTYRDLWKWLDEPYETPPEISPPRQLSLPAFNLDSRIARG